MEKVLNKDEWIKNSENITVEKAIISHSSEGIHSHNFIEIIYIMGGNGCHTVNHIPYSVEKGDLIFLNIGDTHAASTESGLKYINCLINPEFLGEELLNSYSVHDMLTFTYFRDFNNSICNIFPKVSFRGEELYEAEAIIENMHKEYNNKDTGYLIALKGYMNVLLAKMFRTMSRLDKDNISHEIGRIAPEILQYIESNYREKITLKELARKNFYTPSYFGKMFKERFGKSITEYIYEKRINEAVKLLRETDISVDKICYLAGYKDRKHFYNIFKSHTGLTPMQFRKQSDRYPHG